MNQIIIEAVANGYLVSMPCSYNPYNSMDATQMALAIAKGTSQSPNEIKREVDNKKLEPNPNVFIFDSMEKVLSFLANKFL